MPKKKKEKKKVVSLSKQTWPVEWMKSSYMSLINNSSSQFWASNDKNHGSPEPGRGIHTFPQKWLFVALKIHHKWPCMLKIKLRNKTVLLAVKASSIKEWGLRCKIKKNKITINTVALKKKQ